MPLGVIDLWSVTDRLIKALTDAASASRLWVDEGDPDSTNSISVTGLAPDVLRDKDGSFLSVYLFHVTPDKFHRNTPPQGGRPLQIRQQPLALTLYYLVSAHAKLAINEQRAMSIALKWFHEHPFVSAGTGAEDFTLTIEPETLDEVGRLWQATGSALRLSAVYRASVVFIEPEPPAQPAPKLVTAVSLDARQPADPLALADGTVTASRRVVITGAGFDPATTVVQIGTQALTTTNSRIPEPGKFRVVNPTAIDLQFPAHTPPGRYLVEVRATAAAAPTQVWLEIA